MQTMIEIAEYEYKSKFNPDDWIPHSEEIDKIGCMGQNEIKFLIEHIYTSKIYEKIQDYCHNDTLFLETVLEEFQSKLGEKCLEIIENCNLNNSKKIHFIIKDEKDTNKLFLLKDFDDSEEFGRRLFNVLEKNYCSNPEKAYTYNSLSVEIYDNSFQFSIGYVDYIVRPVTEEMFDFLNGIKSFTNIYDKKVIDKLYNYIFFDDFEEFILDALQENHRDINQCIEFYKEYVSFKDDVDFKELLNAYTLYDAYLEYKDLIEYKKDKAFHEFLLEYNNNLIKTMEHYGEYKNMLINYVEYKMSN